MRPTVSIIMTSYNYGSYIGSAIESVLMQTYGNWELLIVDDCSTDNSWAVISSFSDSRIKSYQNLQNCGAVATYNRALSMASGEFIGSLDSDDSFMPEKLGSQIAFFSEHPDVDICGTFVCEIDKHGGLITDTVLYANWFNYPGDLNDPRVWLWENHLCHSSVLIRRRAHDLIGNIDNDFVYTPDWRFWLRALVLGVRFSVIPEVLVAYRNHGENITHKNKRQMLLEHAETTYSILFPWLFEKRREDLIALALKGFLESPLTMQGGDLPLELAKRFCSGGLAAEICAELIHLSTRDKEYITEINKGKVWLEEKFNELTRLSSELTQQLNKQAQQLNEQTQSLNEQALRFDRLANALPVRLLRKIGLVSYD